MTNKTRLQKLEAGRRDPIRPFRALTDAEYNRSLAALARVLGWRETDPAQVAERLRALVAKW